MGQLVFQATLGGQVNLVGPNTASTFNINVPAFAGTMASLASVTTNGVTYVNSSGQPTTGTALTFDGTNFATTGTATATKLIPTGSSVTGNGLYLPAANSLGLSTNGTNAVYIDASQNVGIGTSSPGTKLEVKGAGFVAASVSGDSTSETQLRFNTNTSARISQQSNQPLLFDTNGTERMRIDSSGNLLVGTTAAGTKVGVGWNSAATQGISLSTTSTTFTGSPIVFYNSSGGVSGFIGQSASSVTYSTSSDYRLKDNVQPITTGLATVSALKPVTYDWKIDGLHGEGFIAHELQEVIPLAVTGDKDAVNQDGSIKSQGVDYSKIVVHLVAACQELKATVDAQAAEITALKVKVGV